MRNKLNGIAVRFDSLEQRSNISKVFEENRFEVYKGIPRDSTGYFAIECGVAQSSSASVYNHRNKLSYEEFMDMANDTKEKIKISLRLQPDNRTVVYECLYLAEELRGVDVLIENDTYSIRSSRFPIIREGEIRCRGTDASWDFRVCSRVFDSEQDALNFINNINLLVDKFNNPITYVSINYDKKYNLDDKNMIEIAFRGRFNRIKYYHNESEIKVWYVDNNGKEGQPLSEVVEEFNTFFKKRDIKVELKDEE